MKIVTGNELIFGRGHVVKFGRDIPGLRYSAELQTKWHKTPAPSTYAPRVYTHGVMNGNRYMIVQERATGHNVWGKHRGTTFDKITHNLHQRIIQGATMPVKLQLSRAQVFSSISLKVDNVLNRLPLIHGKEGVAIRTAVVQLLVHARKILLEPLDNEWYLPQGIPHGDFTTVNMLYNHNAGKLCVFDFARTYMASPVLDLSKLMQDVEHGWMNLTHKWGVSGGTMEHACIYIESIFGSYPWWPLVRWLTVLDLLRIVPYAVQSGDPEIMQWLYTRLNNIPKS